MSDLPDFIQPTAFSSPKVLEQISYKNSNNELSDDNNSILLTSHIEISKPSSLPEFLRLTTTKDLKQLQAVYHPSDLMSQLNQYQTLWLDLEIDPKSEALIDGAFLAGDH